jgi:heat shock protein HslJ
MNQKTHRIIRALASLLLVASVAGCGGVADEEAADSMPEEAAPAAPPGADALVGEWELVVVDMNDGEDLEPSGEALPVLDFTDEAEPTGSRRFGGTDGCNRMLGSYDAGSTGRLAITAGPATTLMACPDSVMRLATIFRTALESATAYEIDGDQLALAFGGGVIRMQRPRSAPNRP